MFVHLSLKSLWIITSISSRIDFQIVETDDEEIARKQRNRPQVPHPTWQPESRQINLLTVPKNIIGAPKIQNYYDAIQLFSIAHWKLSILFFLLHFWYLFFVSFLAILTVLFALRGDSEKISVIFANRSLTAKRASTITLALQVGREITIWDETQKKKKPETNLQN